MKLRNKLVLGAMILIGALIFWNEMRQISFSKLVYGFNHLKWGWLIVAVILMFLSFYIESLGLGRLLQRRGQPRQPRWNLLRVPMIEEVFNDITPFSSGGQPAQLVALLEIGYEGGRAGSVLLLKFIIYQVMILLNFILTMVVGFERVMSEQQGIGILIVFGFVIHIVTIGMLLMIMFYYQFTKTLVMGFFDFIGRFFKSPRIARWREKAARKIDTFHHESILLKKEKKKVLVVSFLTLLQLFVYYMIPYFVLLALRVTHVDFLTVFSMHVMIVMITSIFPIPGGTGSAEYSFKALFSLFVSNSATLVLALFLWRFITFYLGIIMGIIATSVGPRYVPHIPKTSESS